MLAVKYLGPFDQTEIAGAITITRDEIRDVSPDSLAEELVARGAFELAENPRTTKKGD